MTKLELLKLLEGIPDNAIIVKHGHSDGSGYEDIYGINDVTVVLDGGSWAGEYAPYEDSRDFFDREGKQPFTVYRIS